VAIWGEEREVRYRAAARGYFNNLTNLTQGLPKSQIEIQSRDGEKDAR
jgi:hypothetical protein